MVDFRVKIAALAAMSIFSTATADTLGKRDYLELMDAAVAAYDDDHIARYLAEAETKGVQEHGFSRLVANLAFLIANGIQTNRQEILGRMMTVACECAAKGKMPLSCGGNEFSVKELCLALTELERHRTFPVAKLEKWRKDLLKIDARKCYSFGKHKTGTNSSHNWMVFSAASEQTRIHLGFGGDAAFVDDFVADQSWWVDENGMYLDPWQPIVYDLVTRLQFAIILESGYNGALRGRLEDIMSRSEEITLKMQSASGEIPYGGRSNQFLHNGSLYAALCEWYANRAFARGDARRASEFRRAAFDAVEEIRVWLRQKPVRHVKNRYPMESGIGCEEYAFFDKYMVTMGSWAMLGMNWADERIPVGEPRSGEPEVTVTSRDFHLLFLKAGDYSVQFDYDCDWHYDANGIGRVHRRGAPSAICISTPCVETPHYKLERPNESGLALAPAVDDFIGFRLKDSGVVGNSARCSWELVRWTWDCQLTADGLALDLHGPSEVIMALPVLLTDGETRTVVKRAAKSVSVEYLGWRCVYSTDGEIVDTGTESANRNGCYRRYEAHGDKALKVNVTIEKIPNGIML